MLCSVYKSAKKAQTYLFINKRDDFSEVPEALMKMFGKPEMVTVLNNPKGRRLTKGACCQYESR